MPSILRNSVCVWAQRPNSPKRTVAHSHSTSSPSFVVVVRLFVRWSVVCHSLVVRSFDCAFVVRRSSFVAGRSSVAGRWSLVVGRPGPPPPVPFTTLNCPVVRPCVVALLASLLPSCDRHLTEFWRDGLGGTFGSLPVCHYAAAAEG